MQAANFDEVLDAILEKDRRFHRDAYVFVREALDFTQKMVVKSGKENDKNKVRHVSGQELLEGIRDFSLDQFGPMTLTVLTEWGIQRCEDFGDIVFNMVEHRLLAKTKEDRREDFKGGYDFDEVFHKPFRPTQPRACRAATPKTTQV